MVVMRLSILDLRLLVRMETRLYERLLGTEGVDEGSHEAAVIAPVPEPEREIMAADGALMLDARTRDPSGKCNVSGLGGRGGGAGETGRVAAFLSGIGGVGEAGFAAVLAVDAWRRCSSAKAVEAKGKLFGLSERVGSRLILLLVEKGIMRMDDGRLMAAFTDNVGEALEEGRVGRDFVERESRSCAAVVDGAEVVWQSMSRLVGAASISVIVDKL